MDGWLSGDVHFSVLGFVLDAIHKTMWLGAVGDYDALFGIDAGADSVELHGV